MKIKHLCLTLLFAGIILLAYKAFKFTKTGDTDRLVTASPQQILAVYDTSNHKIFRKQDSILHYTLTWINNLEKSLPTNTIQLLLESGSPLFINLEIYAQGSTKKFDENMLVAITTGEYDLKLTALFKILSKNTTGVYLRYNGDMEVPSYKYPWQVQSFTQYIASFRHIKLLLKKYAPAVKMVFGPSGYPGAEEYWPGEDYVDAISLNMNAGKEFEKDPYPTHSSINEMIRRKLFRMRFMKKTVLLLATESFKGPLEQSWLDEVNDKIAADLTIYETPVIPSEHDTAILKMNDRPAIQVGLYDPGLLLTSQAAVTAEHIFTDMISIINGSFKRHFDSITARHHNVVVTVEQWQYGSKTRDTAILEHTLNGYYDKVWTTLYKQISNVPQTVYLRWAHEMEIPIERYEWQSKDPVTYIKAFRYVANFQKPRASNIKMIWGPAGDRGSIEWWPGEDVVDLVSFAIYGMPDKDINDYNKQYSFTKIFQLKLYRMRFTHKPVFITEFGVKGPEEYQRKWMDDAANTLNKYPEVRGVSYFNFVDVPKAWGKAETPVWSISEATFKSFTKLLK